VKNILIVYILILGFSFNTCTQSQMKHTNHLVNETSPYLLQHAKNPVNWYPWGEDALEKAKKENKLIIISIGYSACHWCHVMEKESFEDIEVAKIMNENFICIKVDREERPDVDQVYMNAVHLMKQRGGWPLNCITLPNGKPVWGGTYFRKRDWMQEIKKVADLYRNSPEIVEEYANKITEGIANTELVEKNNDKNALSQELLEDYYQNWSTKFDHTHGGRTRSPKFPLPNNYQFLLDYGMLSKNQKISDYVQLTLNKMADGGIYDHIGGGFCRYSTDQYWKVPHFEKMLYDNAQLISLYSNAYLAFKSDKFKSVIYKTLEFIERELYDATTGAFYSSLDADSEGEEGKFYVWEKEELQNILQKDYAFCEKYYNINNHGLWDSKYILLKKSEDDVIRKKYNLTISEFQKKVSKINDLLFKARKKRIRPGLDDKSLTSWNGLMLKGYVDANKAFGDEHFLKIALKNGHFILKNQIKKDGSLLHSYKDRKSTINGFLEDYAFIIEGFIGLYEVTFDDKWLTQAHELMEYALEHFFDTNSGMFFFTSNTDKPLITRKFEITDNVIPASNSSIAKSLFFLGHILVHNKYLDISEQMLHNVKNKISEYGPGYSNWASLITHQVYPFYEVMIVGNAMHEVKINLLTQYLPNKILIGGNKNNKLDVLKNKFIKGETMIYVCQNGACQKPTNNIEEALLQIIYK